MNDRQKRIRNFCIIAHIDHGKSTLADRLIEKTHTVSTRELQDQLLDSMDLERERGITIKLTPVRMYYEKDGEEYELNLIDTPGHVDFTFEVSRSLRACEGAVLVVDAAQGVEAQTLANVYLAIDNDLEILPVINKIDLPSARPEEVRREIEDVVGIDASDAPLVSAKEGVNIESVLDMIADKVPPPSGDENAPLKCLIFDSYYDNYKGAVCLVRVIDGQVKAGTRIRMMASGREYDCVEVGIFDPKPTPVACLRAGNVGYVAASIKAIAETAPGDTITDANDPTETPCAGYKDCEGYTSGSGKTCTCGDKTYYESCGGDQCDVALEGCSITSSHWQNTGHYLVKEGCGGYRYYASCNAKSPDCDGVMPPCAGKKICLSHQKGVGTACSCGGKTYYDSCESEDVCTKSADTEWEDSTIFTTGGEYKVREYCTDPDTNRTLYYHRQIFLTIGISDNNPGHKLGSLIKNRKNPQMLCRKWPKTT